MTASAAPALEIKNLTKHYGPFAAVKDLSLTIQPGEIFGLLGPNGAGKSSTIHLASSLCRMEQGSIKVFGHDVVQEPTTTRRLLGLMHQEVVIDNFLPIGRMLKMHAGYYGLKDDPEWRELLIERLALGAHVHKKMMGLSGGMKRRFMVAKALIHKPRLLVLDEPTAGVDVELRLALWEFVKEINKRGTTVVLTTHYLEEAQELCGRIAIMNHGQLVALDTTKNLTQNHDLEEVFMKLTSSEGKPA
ncbi:MAG: ATP-binding cassette domain-containing protein [Bdellovibrionota bacterium]